MQVHACVLYFWAEFANSLINLHMKNPTAPKMKDKIVKVSTLIHGVR
jgi:hypothetical protein